MQRGGNQSDLEWLYYRTMKEGKQELSSPNGVEGKLLASRYEILISLAVQKIPLGLPGNFTTKQHKKAKQICSEKGKKRILSWIGRARAGLS